MLTCVLHRFWWLCVKGWEPNWTGGRANLGVDFFATQRVKSKPFPSPLRSLLVQIKILHTHMYLKSGFIPHVRGMNTCKLQTGNSHRWMWRRHVRRYYVIEQQNGYWNGKWIFQRLRRLERAMCLFTGITYWVRYKVGNLIGQPRLLWKLTSV